MSISGGSTKVTYNASLGYSDQAGIELNNDAKNLSGRVNVGAQLHPKVHVDVNLIGSINKTWGYAAEVSPMKYATETSRSVLAYDITRRGLSRCITRTARCIIMKNGEIPVRLFPGKAGMDIIF